MVRTDEGTCNPVNVYARVRACDLCVHACWCRGRQAHLCERVVQDATTQLAGSYACSSALYGCILCGYRDAYTGCVRCVLCWYRVAYTGCVRCVLCGYRVSHTGSVRCVFHSAGTYSVGHPHACRYVHWCPGLTVGREGLRDRREVCTCNFWCLSFRRVDDNAESGEFADRQHSLRVVVLLTVNRDWAMPACRWSRPTSTL